MTPQIGSQTSADWKWTDLVTARPEECDPVDHPRLKARAFEARMNEALHEDFNTSQALAHLFSLARAVNRFGGHKKAKRRGAPVVAPALAAFRSVADSIGLLAMDTQAFLEEVKDKRVAALGLDRAAIEAQVAERVRLREAKQWSEADAIRQELDAKGIVVMDGPEGSRWRVRPTTSRPCTSRCAMSPPAT